MRALSECRHRHYRRWVIIFCVFFSLVYFVETITGSAIASALSVKQGQAFALVDEPLPFVVEDGTQSHATPLSMKRDGVQLQPIHHEMPCKDSSSMNSMRVCDPDQILRPEEMGWVVNALHDAQSHPITCHCSRSLSNHEKETVAKLELQVAVALVNQLELHGEPEGGDHDVIMEAAESLARSIHDHWGVGMQSSSCGGSGVVIFLAVHDRAIYISRGQALEPVLTDRRLDAIIVAMKPFLADQEYGNALVKAIQDIYSYVDAGEPGYVEWLQDHSGIFCLVIVLTIFVWSAQRDQRRRKRFLAVSNQLSELDHAKAKALAGKYCATTCPICLEAFPLDDELSASTCHTVPKLGSDGKPPVLLKCGHVFDATCWNEWKSNGRGRIDQCPICKESVGLFKDEPLSTDIDRNIAPVPIPVLNETSPACSNLQLFYQERAFRLERLHHRYPEFLRPREVQRWSQPDYDGSMAQDPVFLDRGPGQSNSDTSSSQPVQVSSFGGGTSSGGRGGRW